VPLRPTHRQIGSPRYRQPGGAWDVPTLDEPGAGPEIADSRHRLDHGATECLVGAMAGGLRAAGVSRGDAVAWQLPNCVEAAILFRACWRLGAVAVPFHHLVGPSDIDRMLAAVEPKVAFAGPGLPLGDRAGVVPGLIGADGWEAMQSAPVVLPSPARGPDLAVALFTSGSMGEPKVVLHTHRALSYKAITLVAAHGLRSADTVLTPAPLSHISGLLSGLLIPAAAGMRAVLMERWDPDQANDVVQREQVTFMAGPPTFFSTMAGAANFSRGAMASMRLLSCGSMTVSPEFVAATAEAFGASVKRTYGSTEAPNVTTSTWDDPPERARETDGRAVGMVELRVVDPETMRPVEARTPGELLLRGPELFCGYADPAQTAAAMAKGWYRTGDLATLDEAGWLTIIGRLKQLIIRGGENVVPAEIERILEAHAAIDQAVVVGYPDDRLGQRVAACVMANAPFDLEECRAWFTARGIARFKIPERVITVDRFPLLSLGKPDRLAVEALVSRGS
jgi:acyl-CoA synthetase (AMP-forming)/AMP-acid ligase II